MILAAMILSLPDAARSQDAVDEETPEGWERELIGNVSGTQAGFQNWAEGGVSTLALSLGLNGSATWQETEWQQEHTFRLNFGLVKQDTLEFRKAEDLIRFRSTFSYDGDSSWGDFHPVFSITGRTQFASGFNFEENPFEDGREPPVKVSEFMSPATSTESLGMSWQPTEWFSQQLGVAAKQTVVLEKELRPVYNVNTRKSARYELGIDAFSNFEKEVFTDVLITSLLGVFAAFNNPDKPDILWENTVAMSVNSWLGVNLEWVLLFDNDISSQAQFKEVFSLSVAYHFL